MEKCLLHLGQCSFRAELLLRVPSTAAASFRVESVTFPIEKFELFSNIHMVTT